MCYFLSISSHATCISRNYGYHEHATNCAKREKKNNRKQAENEVSEDQNYHRLRNRSSRVTFPFHPRRDSLCFQRSFDSCLDSKGSQGWRREVISLHTDVIQFTIKQQHSFARDTKSNVPFFFFFLIFLKEPI